MRWTTSPERSTGSPTRPRRSGAPRLTEAQSALDGIDATVTALPAEGKSALKALVAGALPAVQSAADKLLADSTIGPVVKPVLDPVLAKLKAYAA